MHLTPTNPTRRLNHAPRRNHRAPPNTNTRGRDFFARLRGGHGAGGVQVAAELDVGHDDGAAAEGDVCCAGDGGAAGDFVA